MIISSCRHCPFLQPLLGGILEILAPDPGGMCGYRRDDDSLVVIRLGLPPGPAKDAMIARARGRARVRDASVVPDDCPLREHDVVVSLGLPGRTS